MTLTWSAGPGGVTVALSSSNPSTLSVPATVFVPEGSETATFPATLQAAGHVSITASVGSPPQATTSSFEVLTLGVASVYVANPYPVASGYVGEVTLNGFSGAGGVTVTLSSSDPSVLGVPENVSVAGGQRSAQFPVNAPRAGTTTITATYGTSTRSVTITVEGVDGASIPDQATVTATPEPTVMVTAGPTDVASSTPTSVAMPEHTPTATIEPIAEPSVTPTAEPTETVSPAPTETASPTSTETPAPSPTPTATEETEPGA